MVYLNIDKEFFEKNKNKAEKQSIEELGDEGKNNLIFDIINDEVNIEEIDDTGKISISSKSDFGWVYTDVKLDNDDMLRLIELFVKKLNKFKSLLESIK
jgi:hypothetical protein